MKSGATNLLELLIEHESALGRLYVAFAGVFNDTRVFWQTLAGDEQRHARGLGSLLTDPKLEQWLGPEVQSRSPAVKSSTQYVNEQEARAQAGGFSQLQALAVAKDIEDALIERLSLPSRIEGCAQIDAVVAELQAETNRHRELIGAKLEAERHIRL